MLLAGNTKVDIGSTSDDYYKLLHILAHVSTTSGIILHCISALHCADVLVQGAASALNV